MFCIDTILLYHSIIKIIEQVTYDQVWKYIFISRRGCLRTGARYHTRGADPMGNVANFVETEQMIEYPI